jgi:hypothetical protein
MRSPTSPVGGKICRSGQLLPGSPGGIGCGKAWFYWVFHIGTTLADQDARSVGRHARGFVWSSTMFFALGAASSAIDALKALTSSKSSAQTTGVSKSPASPFDLPSSSGSASIGAGTSSGGGGSQISPQTMSALLDAQSQSATGSATTASKSRSAALKDLFGQIDGDGDGKISKKEFETALGAGGTNLTQADSVFGKLDKDGDGSVTLKELASALKGGKHRHEHAENSSSDDGSNSDPFSRALQGASSTSVTNSDGTVTTSLTYADGSKVTMTSAASKSASTSAASSYNFIEQMIQRQAQAISSAATASLSVSV